VKNNSRSTMPDDRTPTSKPPTPQPGPSVLGPKTPPEALCQHGGPVGWHTCSDDLDYKRSASPHTKTSRPPDS